MRTSLPASPYNSATIPLIAHTPRLLLLAASRALLTAELHKPQYFPVLLGAALPAGWPSADRDRAAPEFFLPQLTKLSAHHSYLELSRTLLVTHR